MSRKDNSSVVINGDINLASAKHELYNKIMELAPVVKFYEEIYSGWEKRFRYAATCLFQIPETDERNTAILTNLRDISKKERDNSLHLYNTVRNIKTTLEQKLQDLNMYALQSNGHFVSDNPLAGLPDFRRALHEAEALLELRYADMKEISA